MNILLLAFEGESFFMGQLALNLRAAGHGIHIVNCDHYTITGGRREIYNYYDSIGISQSEYTNLGPVFEAHNQIPEDRLLSKAELDELATYETNYCSTRGLNELLSVDPLISPLFHPRSIYYNPENPDIRRAFLLLLIRQVQEVMARGNFDVAFTIDCQYLVKSLYYEACVSKGIPFQVLTGCRIRDLHLLYDNFLIGTPANVRREMQRIRSEKVACTEAHQHISGIVESGVVPYTAYSKTLAIIERNLSPWYQLKALYRALRWVTSNRLRTWKRYRRFPAKDYFLPSFRSYATTAIAAFLRIQWYRRIPRLNRREIPETNFVYFPMHVMPESSTMTLSPTQNEFEAIYQLSRLVPANWVVLVKPNPYMFVELDAHAVDYYLRIASIPNVVVFDPVFPSRHLVSRCSAVACLTGTTLLEGAIFRKPGFRWGNTEFDAVNGIYHFNPGTFREDLSRPIDTNVHEYFQACLNIGFPLDLSYLIHNGTSRFEEPQYKAAVASIAARITAPESSSRSPGANRIPA